MVFCDNRVDSQYLYPRREFMKQQKLLPVKSFSPLTLAIAALVVAVTFTTTAVAQTYSAIYEFGNKTGDPANPQYSGIIAQGRDGDLYSTTPDGGSSCSFCGTVFKITPLGTLSVVYNFNDTTGAGYAPLGGLTLGTDGNFYGTTQVLGQFRLGTVFKITASGTLTTLYNFGACAYPCLEGTFPIAPPVQGTDGNFYGTTPTRSDGTNQGVVYKITSAGKFTTLYAFTGTSGYNPNAPLMQGADGNFYGTTTLGGKTVSTTCVVRSSSSTCGTVFKITPAGKVTFIYEFDKTHGAGPIGPVIQGTDGNFYGTTSEGGANGFGVIFKLTSAGVLTVLHDFNGTDGQTPVAGLVQANDGNLYGVASAGGLLGYGAIFKSGTSPSTFSVLYNFDGTHGATPEVTLFQHTNGILYGDTDRGGLHDLGAFYSLNIGAAEFARLQSTSGKVGSSVAIFGQGFTGTKAVSFSGVNATPVTVTDTYLTVNVPSAAKTGTVTVVRPSGNLASIQQFKVTPTISSFSPTSGKVGIVVTITGTGLTQTTKVTFGGVNAAFTVTSDSKVAATVPSGAKTGKVIVTTAGGTATSSGTFTVTP